MLDRRKPLEGGRLAVLLIVALVLGVGAWRLVGFMSVGDLGLLDSIRAKMAQREMFTPEAWRSADPKRRGLMLADLAQQHRFKGMPRDSVHALLGPPECYWVQDGFPCYPVHIGDKRYELRMSVREELSPQRIGSVDLEGVAYSR